MLPEEALRTFYSLTLRWYESESIPEALTQGIMVSLPKPHKVQQQQPTFGYRTQHLLAVFGRLRGA